MILLHTSDWHLGMTFRGGLSYIEDQRYMTEQICRIAVENRADGILIAGDVFDRSIASREALLLYDEVMEHICADLGIPVYMIAGNHDGAERLSQCKGLLKKSGLYIAGALSGEVQVVNAGDTDIYLLPWISTDKVRSIYPDEAEETVSMEDAYRVVLDRYREGFVPGHKNILAAHAFIVNAETSTSDRAAEAGQAAMVGAGVFRGFDYVALGHLHGPQSVTESIRYSGSPMAYSFGREEKQVKSVTIIDTRDMSQKIVPVPALHKRTTLKGNREELMDARYEEDIIKGYVRLEVEDSYAGIELIAAFRERYPNLLEVAGKSLEREDASITMTIEEFEQAGTDPEEVFERYCRDTLEEEPGEHLLGLFREALRRYEKGVSTE